MYLQQQIALKEDIFIGKSWKPGNMWLSYIGCLYPDHAMHRTSGQSKKASEIQHRRNRSILVVCSLSYKMMHYKLVLHDTVIRKQSQVKCMLKYILN